MKISITQFVTLDGVSQGPGSADEDTSDGFQRGGWFVPYLDEAFVKTASDWLDLADGLLLGRRFRSMAALVSAPRCSPPGSSTVSAWPWLPSSSARDVVCFRIGRRMPDFAS